MSLSVNNLTKVYGHQTAVNNISFSVEAGEIVGFLGPNGAGKSTTMKIATGFLPPTSGQVVVDGFDVATQPLEVKRATGYLPEHNPLYLDLYVHEYLRFVGGLYGMRGKKLKMRVEEMIGMCGLEHEQNKKIEALSKGFRQRVGLAQALLHDPSVLILDEPTSGLDPNQLMEIRKLIKTISANKTVIFSTHIMQEVQALCDRVVLINRGNLVADDKLQNLLQKRQGLVTVVVQFEEPVNVALITTLPDVADVESVSETTLRVTAKAGADIRPALFRFAADNHLSLVGLKQEESSLENIFKDLTAEHTKA
ncbi:MAG: gliding motility-associated ABC transporter ATP-binding subunit GldA [Bacteroidia bacterium]|nr:gliding motility-associated ABC transporter ATP-binding subunit GldA [Bacteroidia bacterium]